MAYHSAFEQFPVLETTRLILRKLETSDANDMAEYADDSTLFEYIDGFIRSRDEAVEWIGIWNGEPYKDQVFIRWGIEHKDDKKMIGTIYLFAPEGNGETGRRMDLGYEISKPYRNKGYATEAIRKIVRYGFDVMELKRIQTQIIPENVASIRSCEKAGFTQEGILRNFCPYVHISKPQLKKMAMLSIVPEDILNISHI